MGTVTAIQTTFAGTEGTDGAAAVTQIEGSDTAPPEKHPREHVWDSLTAHFGNPRTKTERSMFGRVVVELLEAGATEAETRKACEYVLATFDSPSVNAVPKWFSVAQNVKAQKSAQQLAFEQARQT